MSRTKVLEVFLRFQVGTLLNQHLLKHSKTCEKCPVSLFIARSLWLVRLCQSAPNVKFERMNKCVVLGDHWPLTRCPGDKIDFGRRREPRWGVAALYWLAGLWSQYPSVQECTVTVQGNHCNHGWTGVIIQPHHSGSLGHLEIRTAACLRAFLGARPTGANMNTLEQFNIVSQHSSNAMMLN